MKILRLAVLFGVLLGLLMAVVPAFADGPGNSDPGLPRYLETASNPNPDAQCGTGAGSGSFGYFGRGLNLGIKSDPTDPGANGYQTGLNNSAVCGNR